MFKYILIFVIFMHGIIHFIGFAKAFNYGKITQITAAISKPIGMLWLLTTILFIATTILFLLKKDAWLLFGFIAVIISQILIFTVWKDAKFGTITNVIILVVLYLNWGSYRFEKVYQKDEKEYEEFSNNDFPKKPEEEFEEN